MKVLYHLVSLFFFYLDLHLGCDSGTRLKALFENIRDLWIDDRCRVVPPPPPRPFFSPIIL